MATAKVIERNRNKSFTDDIQLTLHPIELEALLFVLENIGGLPSGPRGNLDNIGSAILIATNTNEASDLFPNSTIKIKGFLHIEH